MHLKPEEYKLAQSFRSRMHEKSLLEHHVRSTLLEFKALELGMVFVYSNDNQVSPVFRNEFSQKSAYKAIKPFRSVMAAYGFFLEDILPSTFNLKNYIAHMGVLSEEVFELPRESLGSFFRLVEKSPKARGYLSGRQTIRFFASVEAEPRLSERKVEITISVINQAYCLLTPMEVMNTEFNINSDIATSSLTKSFKFDI